MRFLDWIIEELWDAADWFHEAYEEVKDWVSPFDLLQYPLYGLYGVFLWLAEDFEDFNEWVDDVAYQLGRFFTELDLEKWFSDWAEKILDAWYWFLGRWDWFLEAVGDWWATIWPYVEGYVNSAVEGLDELKAAWGSFWHTTWPEWTSWVEDLQAAWDHFWEVTFPNLINWDELGTWWQGRLQDIDTLVNDKIRTWFPFYDDLVELWGDIREFFTDPLKWVYDRLDEFFERFW